MLHLELMLERVKLYMHIHIFKKQNDISNQQTLGMEECDFQSYNIYQSQMSNFEKQTKKKSQCIQKNRIAVAYLKEKINQQSVPQKYLTKTALIYSKS